MQTISHLSVLIHEQAKKYGTKAAITFRNFGSLEWRAVSWNQFSMRVKEVCILTELYSPSLYRVWCIRCAGD